MLIGGKPALNQTSKLMCAYGSISITNPMVSTVQVPWIPQGKAEMRK